VQPAPSHEFTRFNVKGEPPPCVQDGDPRAEMQHSYP
jgi:hypothetical protein